MKELTREIRNRELVSQGLTPLTEAEWNKIINDLRIDAREKAEYEEWNMNEIVNGRG